MIILKWIWKMTKFKAKKQMQWIFYSRKFKTIRMKKILLKIKKMIQRKKISIIKKIY